MNMLQKVSRLWADGRVLALGWLLLSLASSVVAKNPKDDFCRRFAHQTTVIDDKLYIDGGLLNYADFPEDATNYSNTWLGYHDLNKPFEGAADLNVGLNKNDSVPTVQGGVLWADSVNKRFYLYGGEATEGLPNAYHIWSYDIIDDHWDDQGPPSTSKPPSIAAFGAGVGVSETGSGYYYGGWVSNTSMSGWLQPRTMTSDFYKYDYDSEQFTQAASPDNQPRAEGGIVWLPAGDPEGVLVYFGGIVSSGDGTTAPQPLDEIFVFDATGNSWYKQKATGDVPQNRARFCADVAWAPDKSSYNIYLWGGLSVTPPVVNATSFNDVYMLSLPTFTWIKAYPRGDPKNGTLAETGHYSASCNMVKHMSQMFVIGGTFTETDQCDYEAVWGQHTLWTGTLNNEGDNETYWALYNENVTTNVVPKDIYSVVGGDKEGGATELKPAGGFDASNKPLEYLFGRAAVIEERTPTRSIPGSTDTPTHEPKKHGGPKLSTGAIVGIAIAGAVGLALLLLGWFCIAKRVNRKRKAQAQQQQQQQQWRQTSYSVVSSMPGAPSMATASMAGGVAPSMVSQQTGPPPSELPTRGDNIGVVNELPEDMAGKDMVSPQVSPMHDISPGSQDAWDPRDDGRERAPEGDGRG